MEIFLIIRFPFMMLYMDLFCGISNTMKSHLWKKCVAVLCSAMMLTATIPTTIGQAEASNLISNATFDRGTTGWNTYYQTGGVCSLGTDSGRLALKVSATGDVTWAVQVYYDIIPLYQNGVYRLKYDISSTVNRTVDGMIQQNGGDYQAYTSKHLSLTPEVQTVDYEFTMKNATDIMARLQFNCGNFEDNLPEHTIYIDNVSLELVDDSKVDYSGVRNYEPPIVTNQIGYRTNSLKTAVFDGASEERTFDVVNADTGAVVYTGELSAESNCAFSGETNRTGDFSSVTIPGSYYITCGNLEQSYTFQIADDVYHSALDDSVRMLYLQRCGSVVEDDTFGHKACHNTLATIYGTDEKIDVSGGWHDAGDYGRYVVTGAKTVADLLYAYQTAPQLFQDDTGIPESGNGVPDILDEARYEIEWMLKMQDSSGGVHHKVTCATFPGYVMPEEETDELIVTPISTTATADFCGTMALAYEFYQEIDADFAKQCLDAGEKAWNFLAENPNLIFKNPTDIVTGEYGDNSDRDERYWAAAQMWQATGKEKYLTAVESIGVQSGMDSANLGDYGNIAILTMDGIDKDSDVYRKTKNAILRSADTYVADSAKNMFGFSVTQYYQGGWGSNMKACNQGILMGYAYQLTGEQKYLNAANADLNYLFGCNPLGICYLTGYGTVSPEHPHHRPSIAKKQEMPGMLVSGVHPYLEDSAAKAYCSGQPTGKCYVDNQESYSTNEITIYWNSPLTYLLAFTESNMTERVKGDVNADGTFDLADVVSMQRWLLTESDVLLLIGKQEIFIRMAYSMCWISAE